MSSSETVSHKGQEDGPGAVATKASDVAPLPGVPVWKVPINYARTIVSLLGTLFVGLVLEPRFRFEILFLYRNDEARKIAAVNRLCRLWGIWTFATCKAALGLRLVVEGKPPTSGRYLVISNHQASLDIPMLISVFRNLNLKFVAMEELRHGKPAISLALRNGGFAFVAKESLGVDFAELTKLGQNMEKHDGSPMIFPEGKRTEDGSILPWHYAGIEAVRRTARLPLLPVTLEGLWRGRTITQLQKLIGSTVTIRISDPISFEEVQKDPRKTYRATESRVRRNLAEIRRERVPDKARGKTD